MDVNDPLHEQEIFLILLCHNFASVKERFLECLDFTPIQNYASDVNCDVIAAFKAR